MNQKIKDFIRKEKFDQIYNSMISNEPKIRSFLWIWLAKRLLQKLGVSNKMRSVKFDNKLKEQGCRKMVHPKMSNFSARLLNRMVSKLDIERKARKENFLAWQSRLFKITEVSLIYQYNQVSTPYLSVHSMPNLVTAKRVFESLNSIGLPVTTWPDLPPEVLENKKMHGDAIKMRYTQLFLPVHSSIENKKIYSIRIEG